MEKKNPNTSPKLFQTYQTLYVQLYRWMFESYLVVARQLQKIEDEFYVKRIISVV